MPSIKMPANGPGSVEWWSGQLGQAKEVRDNLKMERRDIINRYRDRVRAASEDAIRVNLEFEKIEQKKPQLFYQVPQLQLEPKPRAVRESQARGIDLEQSTRIFREVLQREATNKRGMNTKALMNKLLFDTLAIGLGACVVGYERFTSGTKQIEVGRRPLNPEEIAMAEAGIMPDGAIPDEQMGAVMPILEDVPNQIAWRLFASRISPGRLYIPSDFTGSDYSTEADWLGFDFRVPIHVAKGNKDWNIKNDVRPSPEDDDDLMVERGMRTAKDEHTIKVREVWCFARRIYPNIPHPDTLRRMLFIEGQDEPVLVEDGKHQEFDESGRMVRGLTELPIKVLTLRYLSDNWTPPSDAWITKRLSDELSAFRTQMVVHRKEARPLRWINVESIVDESVKALVQKGKYNGIIPVSGDGNQFMGQIAQAQFPRDNYTGNDYVKSDIDRAWALGANQSGEAEGVTATESANIAKATETRLSAEKGLVIDFWLSIMETASKLLQMHLTEEDYVQVVGEQGAKEVIAFTQDDIQGEFLFRITPDSAERPDAVKDREAATNRWNLMSNSPFSNTEELHKDTMRKLGSEDDRFTRSPEPPQPEGPRVSLTLKSESLSPLAPEFQNVMSVLQASGMDVSGLQQPLEDPEGVDTGEPVGPADAVDRNSLVTDESQQIDHRGGGLADLGVQ